MNLLRRTMHQSIENPHADARSPEKHLQRKSLCTLCLAVILSTVESGRTQIRELFQTQSNFLAPRECPFRSPPRRRPEAASKLGFDSVGIAASVARCHSARRACSSSAFAGIVAARFRRSPTSSARLKSPTLRSSKFSTSFHSPIRIALEGLPRPTYTSRGHECDVFKCLKVECHEGGQFAGVCVGDFVERLFDSAFEVGERGVVATVECSACVGP